MPLREDARWQRRVRQRVVLAACAIQNQTALLLAALVTMPPSWVFEPASLTIMREQENARERERRGLPAHERPWRERLSVKGFDFRRRKDPYEMFKEEGEFKFTESLRFTFHEFEVLYGMVEKRLESLKKASGLSGRGRLAAVLFRMAHGTPFHVMETMFQIPRRALSDNHGTVLKWLEAIVVPACIRWPTSDELDSLEGTLGRQRLHKTPGQAAEDDMSGAVLIVDATNLQISRPTVNESQYVKHP